MNELPKLSEEEYCAIIDALFLLSLEKPKILRHNFDSDFFIHLQGLISGTLENCISAYELIKNNRFYAASTVVRSAFEHAIVAVYLHLSKNGVEEAAYLSRKSIDDLMRMATEAQAPSMSNEKFIRPEFSVEENMEFLTKPNKLHEKFSQSQFLKDIYFVLSQNAHPISASYMFCEYDSEKGIKVIRRTSLHSDAVTLLPHIFRLSALVLLIDAEISNQSKLLEAINLLISKEGFNPNLTLKD